MDNKVLVSFYKITSDKLESLTSKEGQIIFCTDTKKLYLDTIDGNRIEMDGSNVTYTFEQDESDGHKLIFTPSDGSDVTEIIIPDNDTKYTASSGVTLTGTNFTNSGVRSVVTGSNNGTISVNTNGSTKEVAVAGLQDMAFKANVSPSDINGVIPVSIGGTGKATLAANEVLIGNGANAITTRKIDTTNGGTSGSDYLITSGAVYAGLDTKINKSARGAAGGVAELDEDGLIPMDRIPGEFSNVVGYENKSKFPAEGEKNTIYVDRSTNTQYRWDGAQYVALIGGTLVLGETSETAYRGDRGAAAYKHAVTNKGSAFTSAFYKIGTNSEGHVTSATAVAASDIVNLGIVDLNGTQALTNKTYNGYTLAAAAAKAVDTSIGINSTSANLPTSKAVADLVRSQWGVIPVDPTNTDNINIWILTK